MACTVCRPFSHRSFHLPMDADGPWLKVCQPEQLREQDSRTLFRPDGISASGKRVEVSSEPQRKVPGPWSNLFSRRCEPAEYLMGNSASERRGSAQESRDYASGDDGRIRHCAQVLFYGGCGRAHCWCGDNRQGTHTSVSHRRSLPGVFTADY